MELLHFYYYFHLIDSYLIITTTKLISLGKKKERNFSGSTKTPKTNRNQDNAKTKVNLLSQVTQQHEQVQSEKTHSNHQQKHKKNDHSHNKKHTNTTTTMKPKNKQESK